MAGDDDFAADELVDIYDEFGVDATVKRGDADPVPLRIIVSRQQRGVGEFSEAVIGVDTVRCMRDQWQFLPGDLLSWSNRFGLQSKKVEKRENEDTLESFGVLHG